MEKVISQEANVPLLSGLVLAGGKSLRMGHAKDKINWHGKEQRYFMADLLKSYCNEVYISCRADQATEIVAAGYTPLPDTFLNMGPLGGILSALRFQRKAAWLVVACDLPLVNDSTLQQLVQNRDIEKIATTFKSPFDSFPEPLITIWEPRSYPVLLQYLGMDITCPRKVLINGDVNILNPAREESLMNVNSPEDAERATSILQAAKDHQH